MSTGRIQKFNVGVSEIQRWRVQDDVHLPETRVGQQTFLPEPRPLDRILRRETLDERLSGFMVPRDLGTDLLQPAVMGRTRLSLRARMQAAAAMTRAKQSQALSEASALLDEEVELDDEIREALAALLRG